MTNSIPKIEQKDSVFSDFQIKKKTPDYYWQKTTTEDKNDEFVVRKDNRIIITPAEARKTKNLNKIGLSIAGTAILTAGIIFFLLTGGPKGVAKGFENLAQYFEKLILESNMNTKTTPNKILLYMHNATNKILMHIEALNNITSFKDMLFTKIMGVTKVSESIHAKTTKLFEKIGLRQVNKTYKTTDKKFKKTNEIIESISKQLSKSGADDAVKINGVTKTKSQWLEDIRKLNEEIEQVYSEHFGENARNDRYKAMQDIVENLLKEFKDMKIFLSWDTLTKFIAESHIAKGKMAIQSDTKEYRNLLTYSLKDMAKSLNDLILDMVKEFGYKDTKNIESLGKIRANINRYIQSEGKDPLLKNIINTNIMTLKNEINKARDNHIIEYKKAEVLLEKVQQLKNGFSNFKEGKIQKILAIYKELLPEDIFNIVKKSYDDEIKSLDKSIKTETEDFMSKLRDLKLGSAPTDVLTMLASFGVVGFQLSQSEDKQQRQSILLKYGFPAIAGIGVSLYCNAKLYAGTKSLLIGALSSWVLNRIGQYSDNKLKQYRNNNKSDDKPNTTATQSA